MIPKALVRIFTPSFADENNTNAQNLTVKEVVARLPADRFHVTMLFQRDPDARIARRANTTLLPYFEHGNTAHLLLRLMLARPDIYFFPRQGPLDRYFLGLKKRWSPATALVTYVVMMMNDDNSQGMLGRAIAEADRVVANSAYVSETVKQRFAVNAEVIYDGVDRRFFFPRTAETQPSQKRIVLYAGSFQARKRVDVIIEQAARRPDAEFRLAGRGETEAACRALCQTRGCKNVVFLGHLTPAELGKQMRQADIFLFPSVLEGHPQVLIQAAACGLPSIAMSLYRPDIVLHDKTGFLVDDDRQLAEKLDSLLDNHLLREEMSQAAARHALAYDWDTISAQWADVFRKTAAERHNPGERIRPS
jgi:glycosyltransferase involved in cell wall biosynthesis